MIAATALIELFRLVNVVTLCLATLWARDPEPVARTRPAGRVPHHDRARQGADRDGRRRPCGRPARCGTTARSTSGCSTRATTPRSRRCAQRLGVHHFSRKGVAEYNRPSGAFKAKTKHGNYNAWLDRARRRLRRVRLGRPGPRAAARTSASGCSATSATRTWRSWSARRSTATTTTWSPAGPSRSSTCSTRCCSGPATGCGIADAGRHQQRGTHHGAASRSAACRTRSPRTWRPAWSLHAAPQPGDRPALDVGLHPGRARRRRGPVVLDRLLHPAAPLVARHRRGGACAGSPAASARLGPAGRCTTRC